MRRQVPASTRRAAPPRVLLAQRATPRPRGRCPALRCSRSVRRLARAAHAAHRDARHGHGRRGAAIQRAAAVRPRGRRRHAASGARVRGAGPPPAALGDQAAHAVRRCGAATAARRGAAAPAARNAAASIAADVLSKRAALRARRRTLTERAASRCRHTSWLRWPRAGRASAASTAA